VREEAAAAVFLRKRDHREKWVLEGIEWETWAAEL